MPDNVQLKGGPTLAQNFKCFDKDMKAFFWRDAREEQETPGAVVLRRRWAEPDRIDPIVDSVTPLRNCRKADPSPFGDVVANADDQIDLAQSALRSELPQPLAVHAEADRRRWIEKLDKQSKLEEIVHVDNIVL